MNKTYVNSFGGLINVPVYFAALGMQAPPGAGLEPNGGAGMLTFMPGGNFVNTESIAIGLLGLNKDLSVTGSYTLTWDASKLPMVCTGRMAGVGIVHGSPMPFTFELIVSPDGERVEMIHTDAGLLDGVTTLLMSHAACSNRTLDATYSYNATGWLLAPPGSVPSEQMLGGYIPIAMNGALRFYPEQPAEVSDFPESPAGAAKVLAWDTPSQDGQILHRSMTGWYRLNRDCTGTIVLRDSLGNPDFDLEIFVGAHGQAVYSANVNDPVDIGGGILTPPIILGMKLTRMDAENR